MIRLCLAALALSLPAIAQAQDTRTYFTARSFEQAVPRQLSSGEREYYDQLFTAIERQQWADVETLLANRPDGLLHDVARAEYYTHANSPRVELPQLDAWLATGSELPQAEQLGRLALTRGAERPPILPYVRDLQPRSPAPRRTRPRSIDDGTMPADIRSAILDRITNDDPDGARLLLDGIDASLSSEARAEWRQRVAWSYFIENRDAEALAMAQTVSVGSGAWVAEGDWAAGLAAWRLGDCGQARDAFQRAAYGAINAELRSAALYWGARAALRCRQPDVATRLLSDASAADQTLYGMLAAEQLGRTLPERVESADFTAADWRAIGGIANIRKAVALNEIGRDVLGSQLLVHQAKIGDPSHYEAFSRLARSLGFPQTQLFMAYNAPSGASADPAAHYPAPRYQPLTGWQVDPALAFGLTLQESLFRPNAVSPANAQGLMQITPPTLRQNAGCVGRSAGAIDVFEPSHNLALGQCNLQMVARDSATQGKLPKILAAYNAGLTPITRWEYEVQDQGDPLLYMEAIPYWETRGYVAIVTRNYWMYERQASAPSASRLALAQNDWPLFPGATSNSGRVWLNAGYGNGN